MRRVLCAASGAAVLISAPATALAADNGQLVAATPNSLVTFNADGGGARTIWTGTSPSAPVWSPDGNRIAFVAAGRIDVLELATGAVHEVAGGTDADPGWTPDGARVAFRRGADLVSVPFGGGAESALGHVADANTGALAWSPDGWIARTVPDGDVRVDELDGSGEYGVAGASNGRPEWEPTGDYLVYPASPYGTTYLRIVDLDGDGAAATAPPSNADDHYPAWAPDDTRIAFMRTGLTSGTQLRMLDLDSGDEAAIPTPAGVSWFDLDWQPCVAGVTTSCTSTGPPLPAPPAPLHCSDATITAVAGAFTQSSPGLCPGATRIEFLDLNRTHGIAGATLAGGVQFRPSSTFTGTEVIHFRGSRRTGLTTEVSNVATLTVTVTPPPAAPKLTVSGTPKLDRRGRVVLRATCDRACTVSLQVSVKLTTGRVIKGKAVKATSLLGAPLKLTLKRGAIPKHRHVKSARIVGTLKGAVDGLHRTFTAPVKR